MFVATLSKDLNHWIVYDGSTEFEDGGNGSVGFLKSSKVGGKVVFG